jgi:anthranilate phosphoribosyltransferase
MATDSETVLRGVLADITSGKTLTSEEMTLVVDELVRCDLEQETIRVLAAALICALKTRRETTEEIAGAAASLRNHQLSIPLNPGVEPLLDTCGTGGDGAHLINISTITGIVVASLGVRVAKHGNRSVSSSCGSADLLEQMGYPLHSDHGRVADCLNQTGFGFLFAPHFHPALKNLAGLRRTLGVRTIFNMLGPLVNPAGATHQLIGVFDRAMVTPMAQAASKLGVAKCLVVHGEGGLDELSPNGTSWLTLCQGDTTKEFQWAPETFGAEPVSLENLTGGDPKENAEKCEALFRGETPAVAAAVAMNCAACLWLVGKTDDPKEGYRQSFEAIQSQRTRRFFEEARAHARG